VNVVPAFVAHLQAAVLVNPAFGTFDHPTVHAQPAAIADVAPGQQRPDAPLQQLAAGWFGIIRPVAKQRVRTPSRTSRAALNSRDGIYQRQEFGDVMTVGACNRERQGGSSFAVDKKMVFRAVFSAVHGAWSRFFPRIWARTDVESMTARDQSILCWACSLFKRTSCRRFHTPALFQSRSRRQQLIPLPQPISCGRYSQGIPVRKTYRMPVSAHRSSSGFLPGCLRLRSLGGGSNGLINVHSSSLSSGFMARPPGLTKS